MPVDRGARNDREDPSIPEWKKQLIMKKRAERETNKTNAGNDAFRSIAPPLDKAGFKGIYLATCDDLQSERYHHPFTNCPQNDCFKPSDELTSSGRHKMGEDKNLANLDKSDEVDVPLPGHDDDDLQYGPGIVNKLKSRFISMTLKENVKSSSTSAVVDGCKLGMRRYSSLENLLEKESQTVRFIEYPSKNRYNVSINRMRGKYVTRNTNFKRAKSMETLFIEHERHHHHPPATKIRGQRPASIAGHLPESVFINENLIIVESNTSSKDMDASGKCAKPLRQLSSSNSINEEELPKPDTVKTYKRMFEPADYKSGHTVRRKPPVVRASTKVVAALNCKTTGPKHRIVPASRKPARTVPNGYPKAKPSAKETVTHDDSAMNGEVIENGETELNEDGVKYISPEALTSIRSQGTTVTYCGTAPKPQPPCKPASPTSPPPVVEEFPVVSPPQPQSPNEEETDVLKPSTLLGSRQTLWQKPPPATTSIVFDFRGKDVKPNIGLNPTPFGCKPARIARKKRSGSPPRIGKEGLPTVNGNVNGILLDDSLIDDDDSGIGADLPIPSGICFEGENIKVGRGSLLNTRNKKLRIQFNDTATSTFEYPSEASLLEDSPSPNSPVQSSHILDSDVNIPESTSVLRPSILSSSSGLANYTPTMLSSSETFRLGVTKPVYREIDKPPKQETDPTENQEEVLKPADPEDMSSWSSSSTTSDLLF